MAADGTVNIDVILDASQAKGQADDINKMFDDIGDKASSTYKGIVDQYGRPLKMDADTDDADRKVKKLGETYTSIPKDLRTKLVADAEDHGIKNMDELLKKMPRELRTELVAKAQKGEVIDYEGLLKRLPAKMLTDIQLNDHASPALRHIQVEASRTGEQFTSLKDIIRGSFAGNLLASGAQSIMGYLTGIAHEAITTSDAMDKFKMTMKLGGFGSAEIARSSKEVKRYADQTVYDLGDITSTSSQLASNGIKGYEKLTEAAGNLNAQAGGTKDTFKSVALVMTQTAGAGKLTTENWNQMADAMPGASGVLQREMKKNGAYTGNFRDAMANGQITANEFFQAIEKLGTTKGAEEAAKSTETFEGAVGNLEAQIITSMDDVIDKMGKKRITNMINGATSAVAGLTTGLMNVFAFMSEHTTVAKTLLGLMVSIFATKRVADFIGTLGQAREALAMFGAQEAATDAIGSGGSGVAPGVTGGAIGLKNGMAWLRRGVPVATAAVGVGTELLSNNNTGQKVGGSIGSVAGTALGAFAGSFMGPVGTAVGSMAGEWLGKKIGEAAGNAANKEMAGHSIVAHTKVKIDTDTSGQSRAIRPDLNQVARTVIKMDVDSKSIAQTKAKTDKLYSDMSKSLKKYYDDKEKRSQKDLQQLVKEGAITQQQANRKLKAERDADQKRIKQEQSTLNSMQKATNNHYKKLQNIESGQTKKLLDIERKYGKNSKQYNQERVREIQKENQRYTKILVRDQMKADKSINASVKKGASQQEKIYKDLIKRKGKLSQQDLKQTQRDADKQYRATVRPAQRAKDEVIKSAKDKYRETTKTAEREYKENHTISRKQYRDIVNDAKDQRDGTIREANRQYDSVTKTASDQHRKVSREIENQKNDVTRSAMDEATGHISASQTEMQGVNSNYSSGYSRSGSIWNKFLDSIKGVLKFFQQDTKNVPSVATGYAKGTGALTNDQLAMVGEEGFELAHTPRGYEIFGATGPEVRYLSAGTSILTHAQSKAAMAMNGGKMPGYAKGTGAKVDDFVDDVEDGAEDAIDLLGKGISEVWDWLKQKTGLDNMLNSQPSFGGVKRTTHGTFDYAKDAVGKFIKKMADKFLESFGGGGGKMSKGAFAEAAKVAAALMHQSLSSADIEHLYWQALTESTVNPAQNGGYDDHDGTGLPIGLFQFKLSTWNSAMRHVPGNHHNIHSAVDQIMAVLADSTWRSDFPPVGVKRGWTPHGYANGGWADRFAIFGEVPGEPEVAINPKRDTSEEHIAEAIEARAKVNPNGFAGNLSKLINTAKQSAQQLVPVFASGQRVQNARQVAEARSANIDGNINLTMNIDGKQLSRIIYPTMKAMRSHEVIINGAGGAIPVGNAQPLGGVYH